MQFSAINRNESQIWNILPEDKEDVPLTVSLLSPLGRDALHGPPHERVGLQDGVEVVHWEGEEVAVGLCPHTEQSDYNGWRVWGVRSVSPRHTPGVGQQADLPEVRSVTEGGCHVSILHHDVHDPLLDEIHLGADGSFLQEAKRYYCEVSTYNSHS